MSLGIQEINYRSISADGRGVVEPSNSKITMFGFADVVFANGLKVCGFKLKASTKNNPQGNAFVEEPKRKSSDGKFYPVCRPTTAEARRELTAAMIAAASKPPMPQAEAAELSAVNGPATA